MQEYTDSRGDIVFRTFSCLAELEAQLYKHCTKPDVIINFTNPKRSIRNRTHYHYPYSLLTKDLLNIIEQKNSGENLDILYVHASSWGTDDDFYLLSLNKPMGEISYKDLEQVAWNSDRKIADNLVRQSEVRSLILKIPLVPCRTDSLLNRTTKIFNSTKKIPVLSVDKFIETTLTTFTAFVSCGNTTSEYDYSDVFRYMSFGEIHVYQRTAGPEVLEN